MYPDITEFPDFSRPIIPGVCRSPPSSKSCTMSVESKGADDAVFTGTGADDAVFTGTGADDAVFTGKGADECCVHRHRC